ncbi:MAG: hypothetical protein NTU61_01055 [Candidatus Altiarchaeota archaeon]|nr:hypothetical protein [Candidatus Altiarchaeota archaeon]
MTPALGGSMALFGVVLLLAVGLILLLLLKKKRGKPGRKGLAAL